MSFSSGGLIMLYYIVIWIYGRDAITVCQLEEEEAVKVRGKFVIKY